MIEHVEAFWAMIIALGTNKKTAVMTTWSMVDDPDARTFTFNGYVTLWKISENGYVFNLPRPTEPEPEIINLLENDEDIEIKRKIEAYAITGEI